MLLWDFRQGYKGGVRQQSAFVTKTDFWQITLGYHGVPAVVLIMAVSLGALWVAFQPLDGMSSNLAKSMIFILMAAIEARSAPS